MTVAELHAALGSAINLGHGEVEVFVDGRPAGAIEINHRAIRATLLSERFETPRAADLYLVLVP